MYLRSFFSSVAVSGEAVTTSTCLPAIGVAMSGMPTPSSSRVRSRFMYSMALAANASNCAAMPALASMSRSAIDSGVCSVPCATSVSPT
jgi:hypothetical protein